MNKRRIRRNIHIMNRKMKTWLFTEAIKYYCKNPYRGYNYDSYMSKHNVKALVSPVINVAKEYVHFTTPRQIDEYDFGILSDIFVIKATHGCGWTIIVNNDFNKEEVVLKMKDWLMHRYRNKTEKQYAQVTPGVIIEEYLENKIEYGFWMFNGKLGFILLIIDKIPINILKIGMKHNFYDKDWNLLPFTRDRTNDLKTKYDKPKNLEEMIRTVYQLTEIAKNPPFVRVDIFDINNKLYFGEYTFTPTGGNDRLDPVKYEKIYGALIR